MSGIVRNSICIMGLEDLPHMGDFPELFYNKMMPSIDFGAYACWAEKLHNRTYVERKPPIKTLNSDLYLNHPAVRYNRERKVPGFNESKFDCFLKK